MNLNTATDSVHITQILSSHDASVVQKITEKLKSDFNRECYLLHNYEECLSLIEHSLGRPSKHDQIKNFKKVLEAISEISTTMTVKTSSDSFLQKHLLLPIFLESSLSLR